VLKTNFNLVEMSPFLCSSWTCVAEGRTYMYRYFTVQYTHIPRLLSAPCHW
jgi:hypothetical protein